MLREQFTAELKTAMKAGDKRRVDTIRMITAALKDKDIEASGSGKEVGEEDILALLQKLVKSRQELMTIYERTAGRNSRQQEREEIAIIADLPAAAAGRGGQSAAAIRRRSPQTGRRRSRTWARRWRRRRRACRQDGFGKISGLVKAALAG